MVNSSIDMVSEKLKSEVDNVSIENRYDLE
jgi:hypothetical protein